MSKESLEDRINNLEARNKRRLTSMILTYLTVCFYLHFVVHINPWINALVPVIGYTFSTLTLQQLKRRWLERKNG
jgi:hypothetical protein